MPTSDDIDQKLKDIVQTKCLTIAQSVNTIAQLIALENHTKGDYQFCDLEDDANISTQEEKEYIDRLIGLVKSRVEPIMKNVNNANLILNTWSNISEELGGFGQNAHINALKRLYEENKVDETSNQVANEVDDKTPSDDDVIMNIAQINTLMAISTFFLPSLIFKKDVVTTILAVVSILNCFILIHGVTRKIRWLLIPFMLTQAVLAILAIVNSLSTIFTSSSNLSMQLNLMSTIIPLTDNVWLSVIENFVSLDSVGKMIDTSFPYCVYFFFSLNIKMACDSILEIYHVWMAFKSMGEYIPIQGG